MIRPPLQVVCCWFSQKGQGSALPPFIDAAIRAFSGRSATSTAMSSAIPAWIAGAELQPIAHKKFLTAPAARPAQLLDSALHTLVVAWADEELVKKAGYVKWLGSAWKVIDGSGGRHGMLLGIPNEGVRNDLLVKARQQRCEELGDSQMRTWESLGEPAARPPSVALQALEKARAILNQGLGRNREKLQLFISHAKNDGLSLAESLRHAIGKIRGLESFYDAHDIEPGTNWKTELQDRVTSSVLLAIRTDQYDGRPWCIQEVAWADAAGVPIVVVEARSDLFHPPSLMALEGSPWVRVPDGSLTRIVYCALRENVRLLLARRGVHAMGSEIADACEVLPRSPTWESLDGALKRMVDRPGDRKFVVYPDPKLSKNTCEALDRFANARDGQTRVVDYSSLVAEFG